MPLIQDGLLFCWLEETSTGNERFYASYIPQADTVYDEYLDELRKGGLIK